MVFPLVEGGPGLVEDVCASFEDGGASAWFSDDLDVSIPDLRSSWGEDAGAESSAGIDRVLRSSSVSAMTAIRVPTLTPLEPSGC